MSVHIRTPGNTIGASATSSQRVQLTNTNTKFIRVVNGSATGVCFVNAGASTVAATSNNIGMAPLETRNFERDPNNDTYVAVLMSTGTATISVSAVNEDNS